MIPSFEKFMYPVLYILRDGLPKKRSDLNKECASYMKLTKEELKERISSNNKHKIVDRLQWATYYLLKAGLITRPGKAVEQITERGKLLLQDDIKDINRKYLREHYEDFAQFEIITRKASSERMRLKKQTSKSNHISNDIMIEVNEPIDNLDETNNIILNTSETVTRIVENDINVESMSFLENKISSIAQDVKTLEEGLIEELIGIVNDFDVDSFKNLILELIPKMGYTSIFEEYNFDANFTHDLSLSGFFNSDELGLNKFFVIAQNKIEDEIGLGDVQSFIGALNSIGISSGIYITTSKFSMEAKLHKTLDTVRVILIDGRKLAKLLIKYKLGVRTRRVFEIIDVDQEYMFTHLTQA